MAAEIEDEFGTDDWRPIVLDVTDDYARSLALYRVGDVLLVNPVRDGMNLVAKEVPVLSENGCVVVLSTEAGAADEFGDDALLVNPFDVSGTADALHRALSMAGRRAQRAHRAAGRGLDPAAAQPLARRPGRRAGLGPALVTGPRRAHREVSPAREEATDSAASPTAGAVVLPWPHCWPSADARPGSTTQPTGLRARRRPRAPPRRARRPRARRSRQPGTGGLADARAGPAEGAGRGARRSGDPGHHRSRGHAPTGCGPAVPDAVPPGSASKAARRSPSRASPRRSRPPRSCCWPSRETVDLDAKLSSYVELPVTDLGPTVLDALGMRSGIPEFLTDRVLRDQLRHPDRHVTTAEMLALVPDEPSPAERDATTTRAPTTCCSGSSSRR